MKSTARIFFFVLFSELVFLWLSGSQSVARQRVEIDCVLGVEGDKFNMEVLWHKSGVRFSKPSLAKTELATIVALGKHTPNQIRPLPPVN